MTSQQTKTWFPNRAGGMLTFLPLFIYVIYYIYSAFTTQNFVLFRLGFAFSILLIIVYFYWAQRLVLSGDEITGLSSGGYIRLRRRSEKISDVEILGTGIKERDSPR